MRLIMELLGLRHYFPGLPFSFFFFFFFLKPHFTLLFRPGTKFRLQKLQFFYTADQFFTNETHPTVYLLQVKFDFGLNLI